MDWDFEIKNLFSKHSTSDAVFCDVGACLGYYTEFFKSMSSDTGRVFAFEINPKNLSVLKFLEAENCHIENLAISDKVETLQVYSDGSSHLSNIIGHDVGYNQMSSIGQIQSTSLDEYFKNIKVDFLKIDIEGAELKAIKGGINTIKNCKLVVIECHLDEDWKEIYNLLLTHNLKFKNIVNNEDVFYGQTTAIPGRSSIGRPYQMYLLN